MARLGGGVGWEGLWCLLRVRTRVGCAAHSALEGVLPGGAPNKDRGALDQTLLTLRSRWGMGRQGGVVGGWFGTARVVGWVVEMGAHTACYRRWR